MIIIGLIMNRVSKEFILHKIGYHLGKEDVADDPISPAMRLGICMYKLSRCNETVS